MPCLVCMRTNTHPHKDTHFWKEDKVKQKQTNKQVEADRGARNREGPSAGTNRGCEKMREHCESGQALTFKKAPQTPKTESTPRKAQPDLAVIPWNPPVCSALSKHVKWNNASHITTILVQRPASHGLWAKSLALSIKFYWYTATPTAALSVATLRLAELVIFIRDCVVCRA